MARGRKIALIAGGIFAGLVVLGALAPAEDSTNPPAAASEQKPEVFAMPQPDHFALVIPTGVSADQFEGLAKEQCSDRSFCKVFGWTERDRAARALPMSDREVESIAFSYQINRSNSFEQLVFDCSRFAQPDPINCIAG